MIAMTMTMATCAVHTHSSFCDGSHTLSEMAEAAFENGAISFGASGHSYTPIPWDENHVLPENPEAYRSELLRLRKDYMGKMEVLLGIEQDSCSIQPVPDWVDYWIGSVHNLYCPETKRYDAVDWDIDKLIACRDERFHGDVMAMAEAYYADVAAMARRKPTILGHLDLIIKFNQDGRFLDETDHRYRRAALEALHAANPDNTLLEINTGAMARGYRDKPYPAQFLLRAWRRIQGRVILTSDAHDKKQISYGLDAAAEWARTAGFSSHAILTWTGPVDCAL